MADHITVRQLLDQIKDKDEEIAELKKMHDEVVVHASRLCKKIEDLEKELAEYKMDEMVRDEY